MTGLTTHVLDTARGIPGVGIPIQLYRALGDDLSLIAEAVTNAQGRTDEPLLSGLEFGAGTYVLHFDVEAYFAGLPGVTDPPFLDAVTIRFTVTDQSQHYHVPLLVSPWAYSTYRGS